MDGPVWHEPGDAALYRAIRHVWGLAHRTIKPRYPPGVHKHHSIEELDAQRQAWDDTSFRDYRDRLVSGRDGENERR
jgi:hypothetical protein